MARQLVFRFDVDTHRCLTKGTPALRAIAARHGVPFTFFVNMGRATSRRRVLNALARPGKTAGNVTSVRHLGSLRKLGFIDTARIILMNPYVGSAHRDELERIRAAGHELGLHGGRNHREWQDFAAQWSEAEVAAELVWGMNTLRHVVAEPIGFASPTWAHSRHLTSLAATHQISYLADDHGQDRDGVRRINGTVSVATNILGEPGGVGYLEWHRAQHHNDQAILTDFHRRLDTIEDLAVMYDHPFWAGVADRTLTEMLVASARKAGIEIVTLHDAVAGAT